MAAKEFPLEEALFAFGLEFNEELVQVLVLGVSLKWRIEDIPQMRDFVHTVINGSLTHTNIVTSHMFF
jgi:hypothetical protein